MIGDKYQVFYTEGSGTVTHAVFDTWREAKDVRNELFYSRMNIRAAWIMRHNPSLDLRPTRYGHTMRRTKHEAMA